MKSANYDNNHNESKTSTKLRKLFVSGSVALDCFPSPFISLFHSSAEKPVTSFSGMLPQTRPLHNANRDPIPSSPCSLYHLRPTTTSPLSHITSLLSPYHQLCRSVGFVSFLQRSALCQSIDQETHLSDPVGGIDRLHHRGWAPGRYRKPKAPSLRARR